MSRVLDSSFVITLFDPDDPRRSEALSTAEDPEPLLVPPEVLTETLGVIQARVGHAQARTIWRELGELAHVVFLDSTQSEQVDPIFEAAAGALSWTDAAVVAHCLREGAKPLCYDDDIQAAYQARTDSG